MKKKKLTLFTITLAIFGWSNVVNAQYTKLHDLSFITDGSTPLGSLISDGTFLYGMTSEGGTDRYGTLFKIKPDGTGYSKLLDFTSRGNSSCSSLFYDGSFLYGINGPIFKIKPDGTGYSDFPGTAPTGSLISDGTFFYGMTSGGGTNYVGTIFKIKPDGTGYTKLLDFNTVNGQEPLGSLLSDGTFLYGMTRYGGADNLGVIFKIKSDGTGYTKLHDFKYGKGGLPFGSLISDGTYLYGMTSNGYIIKIKPDGTGFTLLFDFGTVSRTQIDAVGNLLLDGNFLYGMTESGGTGQSCVAIGCGILFKIKPDGTGFSKLLDFQFTANGGNPTGSLISDGKFLYGMTSRGGTNGNGVIFKYQYSATTNIMENDLVNNINIFPNPNTGTFTLALETVHQEDVRVKVFSVLGELVYSSQQENVNGSFSKEIKLQHPEGIYFIQLQIGDNLYTKRVIIQ